MVCDMTQRLTSLDDLMAELQPEERAEVERDVATEVAEIERQLWIEELSEHILAAFAAADKSPLSAIVMLQGPGGRTIEIRRETDLAGLRRQLRDVASNSAER
jgi:hypothetical protein